MLNEYSKQMYPLRIKYRDEYQVGTVVPGKGLGNLVTTKIKAVQSNCSKDT